MRITVYRQFQSKRTTISTVYIDGKFQCFGLENSHHDIKIPENTRIPSGIYCVDLLSHGDKHNHYKNRFPNSHRGMLYIKDVPNFKYTLIHMGNYHEDTQDGHLLLGGSVNRQGSENYMIGASRLAYLNFYKNVITNVENDKLQIEFKGEGRL